MKFHQLESSDVLPSKKYFHKRYQIIKSPTVQPFCCKVKLQAYISYPPKYPLHSATALLSVKGTSKMWCRPSQCPSCRHALLDQETSHLSNILGKSNLIPQQNPPELIDMLWKLRKVGFDPKLEVKNQGFVCSLLLSCLFGLDQLCIMGRWEESLELYSFVFLLSIVLLDSMVVSPYIYTCDS